MFTRLIFDHEMTDFLDRTSNNKISAVLLHGMTGLILDEGNFIKRESSDIDVLSFLPKSKYSKIDEKDPFSSGIGRTTIKIGRFVRKFLSERFFNEFGVVDKDIEKFVNIFKSYFSSNLDDLKIVEGDEILKWYLSDNYMNPNGNNCGSLWKSCMRQRERNSFMKMYAKNSNIKMLLLMDDTKSKVRARALLWDGVKDIGGVEYKIMDRIYGVYDHDVNLFKKWAKENGYIPKYEQTSRSWDIFDVNGCAVRLELTVKLENYIFLKYPYLDTFRFFNSSNGYLSNSDRFIFSYILVQSNGMVERRDREPGDDNITWDQDQDHFDDEFGLELIDN